MRLHAFRKDGAPATVLAPARPETAAPRRATTGLWLRLERCPACGSPAVRARHRLPNRIYAFGDETIRLPQSGIAVHDCAQCDLVYKDVVPDPRFLSEVFDRQAGKKWMEPYDFGPDVAELKRVAGGDLADVLDVGAGNGALLGSCTAGGIRGRRSALDVVPHPGLEQHLAGEFIQGFLDAPLTWSGRPYQAVTLFDVLEHLYFPHVAFANLRQLTDRRGLVLIETGNVESGWPRRYGAGEWWYVGLFEHHVFWSRRSLEHMARRHGFRILRLEERRHKSRVTGDTLRAAKDLLKVGLYRASRGAYASLAARLGKLGAQPWSPFARDHLRVFLEKL
ncbi:MAG: class I SAM-dependent methyltransferase [Pseudomonadota bacterium]